MAAGGCYSVLGRFGKKVRILQPWDFLSRGPRGRRLNYSPIRKAGQVSIPLAPMPNIYVQPSIMQSSASESQRSDGPYLWGMLNDGQLQAGTDQK